MKLHFLDYFDDEKNVKRKEELESPGE